ncbi:MAG: baseplate J/gp47 family protein [Bacteroidia bacterium]|nr:baseplate J/gp47 family protein [Bacteroidia bacterium]
MQTADEIEAQIDAEIAGKPEFDGLTASTVSEWKQWKMIFVNASLGLQMLWESFKTEILGLMASNKYGTPAWFRDQALRFQFGDPTIEVNGVVQYAVVDVSKQIITRVAAVRLNKKAVIKVAKETGPLTTEELIAFDAYIEDIKPFTIAHQVVSSSADRAKTTIVIYYDGKLKPADVKNAVETAIKTYLKNVKFNGNFNINDMRAEIRKVSGIEDVDVLEVKIRPAAGVFVTVTREYEPYSGNYEWAAPDDSIVGDRSVITYIPQ